MFLRLMILCISITCTAVAQVNVELIIEQEQLLRSESLPVRVRISNFSGQDLKMAEMPDWISFVVENQEGRPLPQVENLPSPKPFLIPSSKTISLRMDLMPYFSLKDTGRFRLSAKVRVPQLRTDFVSEAKSFDIISGTKLWEREFGVPGHTPPELRKYALQQAEFLKQLRLYVRVTDAMETKVFRVTQLGPIVSFSASTVETQLDTSNNLHVLFQTGRNTHLYCVIDPDGEPIIRQTHEQTTSRPRLRVEEDGRVMLQGGKRKILLSDLPPPRVANTNETGVQK
jgi:hypothetical protein